ncbi:MAG TPA: hypothetical protein VK533_14800 [Sphingomonas sp.]|uniref:hypothetical protein n=1 Tax=Sphingomonas sp. TaxID=28214 RepID=UPI002BCB7A6F|nr:hypothetical protein [Sphingomonas sp.]HMI20803.1 hypothetical protein [Sphingomonas sp.]
MTNPISKFAVRLHQAVIEPALVLALRRSRLRRFDMTAGDVAEYPVEWHRPQDCRAPCPLHTDKVPKLLRRYAGQRPHSSTWSERTRLTPMLIAMDRLGDAAAFDALLKQRSSRTLSKIRKAERAGYGARQFMLASHVEDMHAVRTSMAFRAAGPVFDRWFLKPEHIDTPATERLTVGPPCCPVHWTIWWGIFLPEPGHRQNGVEVGERLVAYVKVMRIGDVVHYTEIMGHRDRLADSVMMLLHYRIVRWLIAQDEPAAKGAKVLLYGAAEHGGAGLLTWKKRAGFVPGRLRLA